jgi:hypothetical protein
MTKLGNEFLSLVFEITDGLGCCLRRESSCHLAMNWELSGGFEIETFDRFGQPSTFIKRRHCS